MQQLQSSGAPPTHPAHPNLRGHCHGGHRRRAHQALSALAVLVALVLSHSATASADANQDGRVDVLDVQMVVNMVLAVQPPYYVGQGDANRDGLVDTVDIQTLVNECLGLHTTLTPGIGLELPRAQHRTPYYARLSALGAQGTLAWSHGGTLPNGLRLSTDGAVQGAPAVHGTFNVELTVVDGTGARVTFTSGLLVEFANQPPVAANDFYQMNAGFTLTVPAPGVLANDTDPNFEPLYAYVITPPNFGTLNLSPTGGFLYTPNAGYSGMDSFTYRAEDIGALSSSATVTIAIGNQPPVATPDYYTATASGPPLVVAAPGVLANDTDPENQPLTATVVAPVSVGTLSLQPNGGFTYYPPPFYQGVATFTYQANDGAGGTANALVTILIAPASSTSSVISISLSVSPNPVRAGEPLTIDALVTDSGSNLPTTNNVQTVTFPGALFGSTITVSMPFHSVVGTNTALYRSVVATNALTYGLKELQATATSLSSSVATARVRFVAYTAVAQMVGPNRTHQTIQDGINACAAFGAVLVDPGTYTGAGNKNLAVSTPIVVAGVGGHLATTIDCQQFGIGFLNPGPTGDTILMGLTVKNGWDGGIKINSSPLLFQMRVTECRTDLHGGGIQVTVASSTPKFIECEISNNVAGSLLVSGSKSGGGMHVSNGAKFEMTDCLVKANGAYGQSGGAGGGIYVIGGSIPGALIQGTRFEDNIAEGGYSGTGGAVFHTSGHLRVNHCVMTGNIARSPAQVVQGPETTVTLDGYEGMGGAIACSGGMTDVLGTQMISNTALGRYEGTGGAVYVTQCGSVLMDQCHLLNNQAVGVTYEGEGGAMATEFGGSLRSDHCVIQGNNAHGSYEAEGGVCFSGTSWPTSSANGAQQWYIGFHNCLITGNSVTTTGNQNNLEGNVILLYNWFTGSGVPTVVFENCTISGNTGGGASLQFQKGYVTVVNTIIHGNHGTPITHYGTGSLTVLHSNIHPSLPSPYVPNVNGNLSTNPLFASVPGIGNYFLSKSPLQTATSPCIDAGVSSGNTASFMQFPTTTDFLPDTLAPDMGYHIILPGTPVIWRSPMTAQGVRNTYPCTGGSSEPPVTPVPQQATSSSSSQSSGGGGGAGGGAPGGPADQTNGGRPATPSSDGSKSGAPATPSPRPG